MFISVILVTTSLAHLTLNIKFNPINPTNKTCKSKIEMQITKKRKKNNNPKANISNAYKTYYCGLEIVLGRISIINTRNNTNTYLRRFLNHLLLSLQYNMLVITLQHNMYIYLSYIYVHIILNSSVERCKSLI